MKSHGVLLLSHVGFSFLESLIALLNERGLRSFVLSSSPLPVHRTERLAALEKMSSRLISTESHVLTMGDVEAALATLRASGEEVLCCISVWEGYRALMAHANALLGVDDLSPAQVTVLRDKLGVRNSLADAGLSRVRAIPLTAQSLESLKASGERYFVKPRSGIASYGAFPLRLGTSWDTLERIAAEAAGDVVYSSILGDASSFIAEGYLQGHELSFEVIVSEGRLNVVAIHEKLEVTEAEGTVLEDSCTSPPHSIDREACAAGIAWVGRVLAHFGVRAGCYHIEARFDGTHWDLIEINPRVGGSLISDSVKALTGRYSMLELWLDCLLAQSSADPKIMQAFQHQLSSLSYSPQGEPANEAATFFRVYFARPGRIEHIGVREIGRAPVLARILLKPGHEVTETAREVFAAELLWSLARKERDATLGELARQSEDALEIRYHSYAAAAMATAAAVAGESK